MSRRALLTLLILAAALPAAAQAPSWCWLASPEADAGARSVARDAEGNAYLFGAFHGTLAIGHLTLTALGGGDFFLLKLDPAGRPLWARSFGGEWVEDGFDVATGPDGSVVVAGQFCSNTIDVGGLVLANTYQAPYHDWSTFDLLVARFDADGAVLWARADGGIYDERPRGLAVDAAGDVSVAGVFVSPTVAFGPHVVTNTGNWDVFVARYDAAGNPLWARGAEGSNQENCWDLDCDSSGDLYVCGSFNSPALAFDDLALTNANDDFDLYVVRLNANGEALWLKGAAGGLNWDDAKALAVDPADDLYVAGQFRSDTLAFATETLVISPSEVSNSDLFLLKLDAWGNEQWIARSTGEAWMSVFAVDAFGGGATVIGCLNGLSAHHPEDLGATTLLAVDSYDIFLAGYDGAGANAWSACLGADRMEFGEDVCHAADGGLLATGWFSSDSLRVGPWLLDNPYNNRSFLARLVAGGTGAPEAGPLGLAVAGYPSPARGDVRIRYRLPWAGAAELAVFDVRGRRLRVLAAGPREAGEHRAVWDGRDDAGRRLPAGVYLCRVTAGGASAARKVVLLR